MEDEALLWLADQQAHEEIAAGAYEEAGQRIFANLLDHQQSFVRDGSMLKSLLCPRRAGKSYTTDAGVIELLMRKAHSRAIIITLTSKQGRENHWGPIHDIVRLFCEPLGIAATYHEQDLRLSFPNGSRLVIAGAETREKIERLRGAEDDIVVIDEPGSFSPEVLEYLIYDIAIPRLISRNGQLWLTGTPGLFPRGPFYAATSPGDNANVNPLTGLPNCKLYAGIPVDEQWSFHTWTLEHNTRTPQAWKIAKTIKAQKGWSDDHPSWRREYLAQWVADIDGLVYAYYQCKPRGQVNWEPDFSTEYGRANHGLPPADWRYLLGMDFGLADDTAFVVLAYSRQLGEARVVHEHKQPDLLPSDVVLKIRELQGVYAFDSIVGDHGGLGGKVYITEIQREHGITIEHAMKSDKNDFIALINSDWHLGRLKIRGGGELEMELETLQWDLSRATGENPRSQMSRAGRLKEDPRFPNHLCDALLYVWRHAMHRWKVEQPMTLQTGTRAWFDAEDQRAAERAAKNRDRREQDTDPYMEGLEAHEFRFDL